MPKAGAVPTCKSQNQVLTLSACLTNQKKLCSKVQNSGALIPNGLHLEKTKTCLEFVAIGQL